MAVPDASQITTAQLSRSGERRFVVLTCVMIAALLAGTIALWLRYGSNLALESALAAIAACF
jgi:hypothetical protein